MCVPPTSLNDLDEDHLYLSTVMLGKQGNCPNCSFNDNPERLQFLREGTEAVYCVECGHQIPPENIDQSDNGRGRLNVR